MYCLMLNTSTADVGRFKLGLVISALEEYPNSDRADPDPETEDQGIWMHLEEYYCVLELLKEIRDATFSAKQGDT